MPFLHERRRLCPLASIENVDATIRVTSAFAASNHHPTSADSAGHRSGPWPREISLPTPLPGDEAEAPGRLLVRVEEVANATVAPTSDAQLPVDHGAASVIPSVRHGRQVRGPPARGDVVRVHPAICGGVGTMATTVAAHNVDDTIPQDSGSTTAPSGLRQAWTRGPPVVNNVINEDLVVVALVRIAARPRSGDVDFA